MFNTSMFNTSMDKNYLLVIIPALIWASMGLVVRVVSSPPWAVYYFAALLSSIIFFVILIKNKTFIHIFSTKETWILILLGLFNVINNVSYFYAYTLTTIANAAFVHYLAPILVALLAPLILLEKTDKKVWFSLPLALLGLFLMTNPQLSGSHASIGILLAFVSAIGYASGVLFSRKATRYFAPTQIVFSQMFFSVLIMSPYILYKIPVVPSSDFLPLFLLGIVYQGVAVLMLIHGLKCIPAQKVSMIMYIEPVAAVLFAALFIKEIPSVTALLGGLLILISCYLVSRR